jgi:peptidoglycan/LPS O-acetylase OafA/YrhL/lysophospholipase L1-like esterase
VPGPPSIANARTRVPALDGLRGLAVIGVLLFHANGRLRGGYLGVDLFFVLSGFLITSILLDEHDATGTIDLRAFWIRRARRLLPALLALMVAVALYAQALAQPEDVAKLRADALATLGYVANWRAILVRRSYWEMFAAPSPLEHTWSLAIEEQFYLVWPLLVAGVVAVAHRQKQPPRRAVLVTCTILGLASCLAMTLLYDGGDTTRVYLGTDTRGAAILAGAALAASGLADGSPAPWSLDILGLAAAIGLACAWIGLDGQSALLYRGGFWATELAAVILVVCCTRRTKGLIARALSVRPLRAMGIISYGVYLWHWPLYVVLTEERIGVGGARLLGIRIAATLAIASLSYRFLERPIRERGLPWGRPLVVVPAAFALTIATVVVCTRAVRGPGAPGAVHEPVPTPLTAATAVAEPAQSPARGKPVPIDMIPERAELAATTMRVLVVGDSVGLALGGRMRYAQATADAFVAERAIGDCSILDGIVPTHSLSGSPHDNGNCARHWQRDVTELRPDVTVVILGGAYFSTVKVAGRWISVCDPGWHDAYARRLGDLLGAIAPDTRRRVVVLAAYPVGHWQTPTLDDKVDCYNGILRDAAGATGAEVVDLNGFVCPGRACVVTSRGAPVRPDGLHFDGLGAEDTARWVLAQLRAGAAASPGPDHL